MSETAKKLQDWRRATGLSQEAAARALLVSVSTYQSWEQGKREPQGVYADKVEAILAAWRNA